MASELLIIYFLHKLLVVNRYINTFVLKCICRNWTNSTVKKNKIPQLSLLHQQEKKFTAQNSMGCRKL